MIHLVKSIYLRNFDSVSKNHILGMYVYVMVDGMFSPSWAQNPCTRSFLVIYIILLPRTKEIWDF